MTDYELMGAALEEAARAAALGEVPVGAVVARGGGRTGLPARSPHTVALGGRFALHASALALRGH